MGFLSKLFGGSPKEPQECIELSGPGTFSGKVVGESYYQQHLAHVFAAHSESGDAIVVDAQLIHDNRNPHDNKAISVEISGKKVGHFSRSEARYFRTRMHSNGWNGMTALCKVKIAKDFGRIVIGSDVSTQLSVELDMPYDFIEASGKPASHDSRETYTAESSTLVFEIAEPDTSELELCQPGNHTTLWMSKDKPGKIFIFRPGSLGGNGRIGFVPSQHARTISSHIAKGLDYESEIIELSGRRCAIECRLFSEEETETRRSAQEATYRQALKDELTKPYNPRKPIELFVDLPVQSGIKAGAKLQIEIQDLDSYLQSPNELCIRFLDQAGNTVSTKKDDRSIIKRILRAHFSSYSFDVEVVSTKKQQGFYDNPAKLILTPYQQ